MSKRGRISSTLTPATYEVRRMEGEGGPAHSEGLQADLTRMLELANRRRFLGWMAGAAAVPLLACGNDTPGGAGGSAGGSTGGTSGAGTGTGGAGGASATGGASGAGGVSATGGAGGASATCAEIPEETGGPYPGDGTNGPNALTMSGIVRSDIRSSFGSYSGTAAGVMAKVTLKVVNTKGGCVPLSGYAVYLWHCTQDGKYSLYTDTNQNYLRGMQEADEYGLLTFTTIFPGCYSGRWPHIHFEVYSSASDAIAGRGKVKTSQMAMPQDACSAVYNTASGYTASVANLAQTSLMTDMVFSDGYTLELPTVTGNPSDGYAISLTVGVAV